MLQVKGQQLNLLLQIFLELSKILVKGCPAEYFISLYLIDVFKVRLEYINAFFSWLKILKVFSREAPDKLCLGLSELSELIALIKFNFMIDSRKSML